MGRAPCCDKANVKRGPWSPEEDAKLKTHIEQHGTGGNWIALPQKIGLKRCGKSCRLRWLNYLRPNIKHGGFTEDEDNLICSLYITIGSRWSIIAAQLPGRTDNDIKNYWNTRLKKKLLGKQRKENQARRDLTFANKQLEISTKKEFSYENFSMNAYSGLYPQQLPQLSEGYNTNTSQGSPSCIDDISFIPNSFGYPTDHDHMQPKDENFDNTVSRLLNSTFPFDFDEIPEESIYNSMPQMESFSALDLVNRTTTTSVSQESSSTAAWGDVNSLIYPPGTVINNTNDHHEFCQPRMAQQEWSYYGEPSTLPGY